MASNGHYVCCHWSFGVLWTHSLTHFTSSHLIFHIVGILFRVSSATIKAGRAFRVVLAQISSELCIWKSVSHYFPHFKHVSFYCCLYFDIYTFYLQVDNIFKPFNIMTLLASELLINCYCLFTLIAFSRSKDWFSKSI